MQKELTQKEIELIVNVDIQIIIHAFNFSNSFGALSITNSIDSFKNEFLHGNLKKIPSLSLEYRTYIVSLNDLLTSAFSEDEEKLNIAMKTILFPYSTLSK